MTDFTEQEQELAQWLYDKIKKNGGSGVMGEFKELGGTQRQMSWLLTARELQKIWIEKIDYYQNYAENHPSLTHEQRYTISCIFDKLKSHFLKDGEDK